MLSKITYLGDEGVLHQLLAPLLIDCDSLVCLCLCVCSHPLTGGMGYDVPGVTGLEVIEDHEEVCPVIVSTLGQGIGEVAHEDRILFHVGLQVLDGQLVVLGYRQLGDIL